MSEERPSPRKKLNITSSDSSDRKKSSDSRSRPDRRSRNDRPGEDRPRRDSRSSQGRSRDDRPRRDNKFGDDRRRGGSRDEQSREGADSRQRSSRGKYENTPNRPSRGKSRDGDSSKGHSRRNSIDFKKQNTGFKVTREKGKERELVWDSKEKTGPDERRKPTTGKGPKRTYAAQGYIRLNRYIANAGICSRREADVLIKAGTVTVNGKVVTEMGVKVGPKDVVTYDGQELSREQKVYLLLNKPKDYVTTMRDPQGRKTVMMLVERACKERIVPVGRLDRETTGLLLFTNDGELAKKLTHPKYGVTKLYHVQLNKKVHGDDLAKLLEGIELEDGMVKADKAAHVGDSSREIGLEIHMGKNRVVRRMMEALGYKVVKLDRVMFAGLTKKNIPRGKYRMLTETEVNQLKMR